MTVQAPRSAESPPSSPTDRSTSQPPQFFSHTDTMASAISDTTLGAQSATTMGPIPMSFPAILRAPNLADRFAHLAGASDGPTSDAARLVVKKNKREDREGKRWIRRKENCMLRWLNCVSGRCSLIVFCQHDSWATLTSWPQPKMITKFFHQRSNPHSRNLFQLISLGMPPFPL